MRVADIFDTVEEIRELQDEMKDIAERSSAVDDRAEYSINKAIDFLEAYIRELMIKEVKE